jgi:predicted TPR repeat methyltransferase
MEGTVELSETKSYRDSHQAKGSEYHAKFESFPHRAMLWRREQEILVDLLRRLYPGEGPAHLDFACGTGRILGLLAPQCRTSTGVDISQSMLEIARESAPEAELIHADITRDDALADRQFDLVTAFRFYRNAEDKLREDGFAAMHAHLADGGYLIFNNHESRDSMTQRVRGMLGKTAAGKSKVEVREFAAGLGLEIVEEHHMGILPMSETRMLKPIALAEIAESVAGALPGSGAFAQNTIFVCRRASRS